MPMPTSGGLDSLGEDFLSKPRELPCAPSQNVDPENDRLLANEDPTDVLFSSFTCIVLNWYLLPLGLGK